MLDGFMPPMLSKGVLLMPFTTSGKNLVHFLVSFVRHIRYKRVFTYSEVRKLK